MSDNIKNYKFDDSEIKDRSLVERAISIFLNLFEVFLTINRFWILAAVLFTLIGSIMLTVIATSDIVTLIIYVYHYLVDGTDINDIHKQSLAVVVMAVDYYLVSMILFIFSIGVYELFIREIEGIEKFNVLNIKTIEELKNKLANTIFMAIVVKFFNELLTVHDRSTLLNYMIAIFVLAISLYFMRAGKSSGGMKTGD